MIVKQLLKWTCVVFTFKIRRGWSSSRHNWGSSLFSTLFHNSAIAGSHCSRCFSTSRLRKCRTGNDSHHPLRDWILPRISGELDSGARSRSSNANSLAPTCSLLFLVETAMEWVQNDAALSRTIYRTFQAKHVVGIWPRSQRVAAHWLKGPITTIESFAAIVRVLTGKVTFALCRWYHSLNSHAHYPAVTHVSCHMAFEPL